MVLDSSYQVAPSGERGLKFGETETADAEQEVAPSGERGLKYDSSFAYALRPSRSLRGAWIEIKQNVMALTHSQVAPSGERGLKFVCTSGMWSPRKVAPSGERGLKLWQYVNMPEVKVSLPPGSVD